MLPVESGGQLGYIPTDGYIELLLLVECGVGRPMGKKRGQADHFVLLLLTDYEPEQLSWRRYYFVFVFKKLTSDFYQLAKAKMLIGKELY